MLVGNKFTGDERLKLGRIHPKYLPILPENMVENSPIRYSPAWSIPRHYYIIASFVALLEFYNVWEGEEI